MIAKIIRGMKRSVEDRRWFLYYLQREITLDAKYRDPVASLISHILPRASSPNASEEAQRIAAGLKDDGMAFAGPIVTRRELDDIMEYLSTKNCYDPRHPEMPGFSDPKDVHSTCFHAYYCDDDVVAAPHLMKIANHPVLIEALELLFGCKPTITSALIWWLFSSYDYSDSEREQFLWNTNNMHRDIDDWLQIKLFIYLTDVNDTTAPHLFIKGSHKGGVSHGKKVISIEAAEHNCSDKIEKVVGAAGLAWLENPFGFHVARRAEQGNRLMAAISYSLLPLPFTIGRRVHDDPDPTLYDPYINRLWLTKSPQHKNVAS